MSAITLEKRIMKLYDRHLNGTRLTWDEYHSLIRLVIAHSAASDNKLKRKIGNLNAKIISLKAALKC